MQRSARRPSWLVALALAPSFVLGGCKVHVAAGAGARAPAAASPRAPAPAARPEGFDEVRDVAPTQRVDVDPQAAFMLRQAATQTRELSDRSTPTGLTSIAVLDAARAEARGLVPEGGLREVALDEGQRAGVGFDLAAGECLTVIAQGGLGIREVDAFVVLGAAPDGDILAQDGAGGPIAIVGGQAGCTRLVQAQHVEVVVLVRKGKGSVVAAIYRSARGR